MDSGTSRPACASVDTGTDVASTVAYAGGGLTGSASGAAKAPGSDVERAWNAASVTAGAPRAAAAPSTPGKQAAMIPTNLSSRT